MLGEQYDSRTWLEPQSDSPPREAVVDQLNPLGKCRCGSGDKYFMCCLPKDFPKRKLVKYNIKSMQDLYETWNKQRKFEIKFIEFFIKYFPL